MLKEKTEWIYIGDELENSFNFILSKINNNKAIIVAENNVFKVKTSHLIDMLSKGKLKEVKNEN